MNATQRSTLALLAGVAIGVAGIEALQAQQDKAPPAYGVANIEVTDPAAYAAYAEQVLDAGLKLHAAAIREQLRSLLAPGSRIETSPPRPSARELLNQR